MTDSLQGVGSLEIQKYIKQRRNDITQHQFTKGKDACTYIPITIR